MKLKRKPISEKYTAEIEALYPQALTFFIEAPYVLARGNVNAKAWFHVEAPESGDGRR